MGAQLIRRCHLRVAALTCAVVLCAIKFIAADDVPQYEGLGNYGRRVTTSSADAQKYFNQGLCFLNAFNHDEAIRSFQKAADIDPNCAMAWWGIAVANGPHINNP